LKVVHVLRSLEFGGAEKLVLELARRQRESGISSVGLVCLRGGGLLMDEALSAGLPVTVTGTGRIRYLSGIRNLARHFRETRPDVVHTHNFLSHVHAAPAARMLGIPVVHTKHGRAVSSFGWSPPLRRYLYGLADAIVAVSEETGDIFSKRSGIERSRIKVVYNGIDTSKYAGADPAGHGMPGMDGLGSGTIVFGCVSRLDPVKDHPTIIRAYAEAAAGHRDSVLLIVGDGPERGRIERMIPEYSLQGRVIMPGFTAEVPRYIAAMSMFLQPSLDEGLSLTILEAAASGVPVVVTPVGGTPEIVEHGVTGTFVEVGDWRGLSTVMSGFILSPEHYSKMAGKARERVEQRFSLASMESAYRLIYEEVAGKGKKD